MGLDGESDVAELQAFCKTHVLFVKTAAHAKLFPRCSVLVHHGGTGTTMAGLRPGRPTVVTPILYDQFDNGHLVSSICGCGVMTEHFSKLQPEILSEAIRKCLRDEGKQQKAIEWSEKLLKQDPIRNVK